MKQDYTVYVRKADGRTRSGWRAISTKVVADVTEYEIQVRVKLMNNLYAEMRGLYEISYAPAQITVKNLMTGADVEIDRDTPWCCNPASETYWSM
jgi:hypothetical protein